MPFHPVVSSPNFPALGLGVLSYLALGLIVPWILPHLGLLPHGMGGLLLTILCISPGVLLGITAKRSPLMHGVFLGLLVVPFMAIIILVSGMFGAQGTVTALRGLGPTAVAFIVGLIIPSTLGAVLGDFIRDKYAVSNHRWRGP